MAQMIINGELPEDIHDQTEIDLQGRVIPIDNNLVEIIRLLNYKRMSTCISCQGNEKLMLEAHIGFDWLKDALEFHHAVSAIWLRSDLPKGLGRCVSLDTVVALDCETGEPTEPLDVFYVVCFPPETIPLIEKTLASPATWALYAGAAI